MKTFLDILVAFAIIAIGYFVICLAAIAQQVFNF